MENWAKLVRRSARKLAYEQPVSEVRALLLAEGLSEEESYLIFCAAMVYCQLRP